MKKTIAIVISIVMLTVFGALSANAMSAVIDMDGNRMASFA